MTTTFNPPRDVLASTAHDVLREHLDELHKLLRRTAAGADTPDDLHELRIACRRLEAVLLLIRDSAPYAAWRRLRRGIRRVRRGGNALRDGDVLARWLLDQDSDSTKAQRELARLRRRELPRLRRRARRILRGGRWERPVRELLSRAESLCDLAAGHSVMARGLFRELARLVDILPGPSASIVQLHRLRIMAKRLRYATEAVLDAAPNCGLTELADLARGLQKRLGTIHDHAVRVASVAGSAGEAPTPDLAVLCQEFFLWWRGQPLERILASATAEIMVLMRNDGAVGP
jgi:CHAD domain-containing protein